MPYAKKIMNEVVSWLTVIFIFATSISMGHLVGGGWLGMVVALLMILILIPLSVIFTLIGRAYFFHGSEKSQSTE